ncbi:hypothetical protein [Cerasicoccus fimbriatus]|uniref:hypothetical protein n=1 Tax=Cerasicoccus fimbriatus TaxID=3014554 RepID=UPI0022B37BDD|nr:hypothetical protein [Cerasicoccus sp. TK19100]
MKAYIVKFWLRLQSIPDFLRELVVVCWLLGPIAVFASMSPLSQVDSGRQINAQELWSTGYGAVFCAMGIGMIILGSLIYSALPWTRHVLLGAVICICLFGFWDPKFEDVPGSVLAFMVLIAVAIAVWNLYLRRDVVAYFRQEHPAQRPRAKW